MSAFDESKLTKPVRAVLKTMRENWERIDPDDTGDTCDQWLEQSVLPRWDQLAGKRVLNGATADDVRSFLHDWITRFDAAERRDTSSVPKYVEGQLSLLLALADQVADRVGQAMEKAAAMVKADEEDKKRAQEVEDAKRRQSLIARAFGSGR